MRRVLRQVTVLAGPAKAAAVITIFTLPLFAGLAYTLWPSAPWKRAAVTSERAELVRAPAWPTVQRPALPPAPPVREPAIVTRSLTVASGDTLFELLSKAGVSRQDAHEAVTALREVYSPRALRPGQEIRLALAAPESDEGVARLLSVSLRPDVERTVQVTRTDSSGFVAQAIERALTATTVLSTGRIESNLSADAAAAGVPMTVLTELIRIFSFDVDFQRDIQPGDEYEVLYDAKLEADGTLAKTGDVLYAAMTLSGKRIELYGFTPKSKVSDFFDHKGQSVRKTLMRTPIDGARLSSRFGMRKHPILGYTRMHRGTDFAAPAGTPIYAAGDGTVAVAGRKGAYGNYVRIRHNSTYETAYAHLSRFAKGMRAGARVRQGEIIGYVGSTGRSTGPHLHYEVMVDGKQVNPAKIKLASGEKLKGADLERFHARRAAIDSLRTNANGPLQTVQADCPVRDPSAVTEAAGC